MSSQRAEKSATGIPLLLLLLIKTSDDVPSDSVDDGDEEEALPSPPAALGEVVTVRSVVSSHVDVNVDAELVADVTSLADGAGVVLAGTDSVSSHDVELAISGVVSDSSQVVDVAATGVVTVSSHDVVSGIWVVPGCWLVSGGWAVSGGCCVVWEVSSVQVVSRDALEVLLWAGAGLEETVSPSLQLVDAVEVSVEDGEGTVG